MTNTKNSNTTDYDLVIVGGGLTGLSLVLRLASFLKKGFINKILLIDKEEELKTLPGRSIAFNLNSLIYFACSPLDQETTMLDCLSDLLEPIKKILVKTSSNSQSLILDAHSNYCDQFGAVGDLVAVQKRVEHFLPLLLTDIQKVNPQAEITYLKGTTVKSSLLAGEDLPYRELILEHKGEEFRLTTTLAIIANGAKFITGLNPKYKIVDHKQFGVIADVEFNQNINNLAIEYFSEHGPVAFLPTAHNRAAVVYCDYQKDFSKEDFVSKLNNVLKDIKTNDLTKGRASQATIKANLPPLPYSVSDLNLNTDGEGNGVNNGAGNYIDNSADKDEDFAVSAISDTASFYLAASRLEKFNEANIAYLGNAAHTLHPVSGQGFNLAVLSIENFLRALRKNQDYNFAQRVNVILDDYNRLHQPIVNEVYSRTNLLAREFSTLGKTNAEAKDFLLYHLIAYPSLQSYIVNPSLGFVNPKQFSFLYKILA